MLEVLYNLDQSCLQLLRIHVLAVFESKATGLARCGVTLQLVESLFFLLYELELQTFQMVFFFLKIRLALSAVLFKFVDQARKLIQKVLCCCFLN